MPMSGIWRVSYSLEVEVSAEEGRGERRKGDYNGMWLHLNDHRLDETEHYTYSSSGTVAATGGREWTMETSAGDTITLSADECRADACNLMYINFCVDFIPKM